MNSTQQLTWYIKNNIPCMFLKYGDGEFNAANYYEGQNCDGTRYSRNLGDAIRESFVYNSSQANAMIAAWHDTSNKEFWESLGGTPPNWVEYHTLLLDSNDEDATEKVELYRAIKESSRKKIYVANPRMLRAMDVFALDRFIPIDGSHWFDTDYNEILADVSSEIINDSNTLILTSAGMGAKKLVSDLHRRFPRAIYIDVGSGFDTLCTKIPTRACSPSYEQICIYLRSLLPPNWE